jgi:hypothetical protein
MFAQELLFVNGMGRWLIFLRRSRSASLRNLLERHNVRVASWAIR